MVAVECGGCVSVGGSGSDPETRHPVTLQMPSDWGYCFSLIFTKIKPFSCLFFHFIIDYIVSIVLCCISL